MPTKKSSVKEKPEARKKKNASDSTDEVVEIIPQEVSTSDQVEESLPVENTVAVDAATVTVATEAIAVATTAKKAEKKAKGPILSRDEKFDLNRVVLAGAIHAVWGSGSDVFARLGVSTRGNFFEEEDRYTVYVTLRFADGMVCGQPITIQRGSTIKMRGYLTHRAYSETLRKFLDDAHAINFFDLVPADDLASWRAISFQRENGVANVLEMMTLTQQGELIQRFGFEDDGLVVQNHDGHFQVAAGNQAMIEGLVARMWEYPREDAIDTFVRLAVYDEHTPVNPKREGNFGRVRRLAHYVNIRFPNGKTSSGSAVRLKQKMRVRVSGELHDKARPVTLREELLKTGKPAVIEMMQRVQDGGRMNEIINQQESLHVLANAVIVYSFGGGSRG